MTDKQTRPVLLCCFAARVDGLDAIICDTCYAVVRACIVSCYNLTLGFEGQGPRICTINAGCWTSFLDWLPGVDFDISCVQELSFSSRLDRLDRWAYYH